MLVAQRVSDWISEQRPKAVCDNCIVTALNLTMQAHAAQITATLGITSDFKRGKGQCSFCRNERTVIRAT